ncbi:MAG: BrnA antitoxin family protein [Woeseia sp.]
MRKNYDFSRSSRGPVVKSKGKTRITIYLDDDVIETYRNKGDKLGRGYQTLINDALKETLGKEKPAVDAKTLRRILRQELKRAG